MTWQVTVITVYPKTIVQVVIELMMTSVNE